MRGIEMRPLRSVTGGRDSALAEALDAALLVVQ